MTSNRLAMLDYNPLWIWLVQKPFMLCFDAFDKILDGKLTDMMVEADLIMATGGSHDN